LVPRVRKIFPGENFRKKMKISRGERPPDSEVRRKRAPDRPWAFRISFPPLVVYRGTPISWPDSGDILVQDLRPTGPFSGTRQNDAKTIQIVKNPKSQPDPNIRAFQPVRPEIDPGPPGSTKTRQDRQKATALRFPNNFWKNVSARDAFPIIVVFLRLNLYSINHSIGHSNRCKRRVT